MTAGMRLLFVVLAVAFAGTARAGEAPPGAGEVATAAGDYAAVPKGDYASRQRAFLEHAAAANPAGLYSQVARLALGRSLDEAAIRKGIATINERRDGADFVANALVRIYQQKSRLVSAALRQEIRAALLGMKYWVDEPDKPGINDLQSMWSENHQINYHAAEYLAGETFPRALFTNNGKDGRFHREVARERVLRYIDVKARTGFTEWDSNNCYMNTVAALINLAELAKDREVAKKAARCWPT
jgi:hypothetical protein